MNISIVIAARTGPGPVLNCLDSLAKLPERQSLEICVADCCEGEVAARIKTAHPQVRVIVVPTDSSIAQARHAAMQQCSGDVIAVLHERYTVTPGWLESIKKEHQGPAEVVGGCVAPAEKLSAACWAMYLSEYSHVCPPMPNGPLGREEAGMLPGGNVSYKRRAFAIADMGQALWELDFHDALFRGGAKFVRGAEMNAAFAHPFTLREYLAERYEVSRDLAALRVQNASKAAAMAAGIARLALPAILTYRIARRSLQRGYGLRLLPALPWILFYTAVQTVGEMHGCFLPSRLTTVGPRRANRTAA